MRSPPDSKWGSWQAPPSPARSPWRSKRIGDVVRWRSERVVKRWQVLDKGGKILAGETEHAGGGPGTDGRGAPAVAEGRDLAEVIARSELSDHLLLRVGPLDHLDLAGGDHVEAPAQLTLADDGLAGAEAHRYHCVAAPDR